MGIIRGRNMDIKPPKAMMRMPASALALMLALQPGLARAGSPEDIESVAAALAEPFDGKRLARGLSDNSAVVVSFPAEPRGPGNAFSGPQSGEDFRFAPTGSLAVERLPAPARPSVPAGEPERPRSCFKEDVWDDGKGGLIWGIPPLAMLKLLSALLEGGAQEASYASCRGDYEERLARYKKELAQWRRSELIARGNDLVISLGWKDQVTVGELRGAGYAVEVIDDGEFRLTGNGRIATGDEEISRVVGDMRTGDRVRRSRQRMAEEAENFVVFPHPAPERNGKSIEAAAATVGELRALGYEVRLLDDGQYGFIGNGGELTGPNKIRPVLQEFAKRRMRERLKRYAGEGASFEASFCPLRGKNGKTEETSCELRATVAEIQGARFSFGMAVDGGFILSRDGRAYSIEGALGIVVRGRSNIR